MNLLGFVEDQPVEKILEIKNLRTSFYSSGHSFPSVDGVSLDLYPGRILGLVGESGSGKTVLSLSIMGMIPFPGKVDSGSILFDGKDLLALDGESLRQIRGSQIGMIFQDPLTSLNPVFSIKEQMLPPLMIHKNLPEKEALDTAVKMLEKVGIPSAEKRIEEYPHQFSGGQRQRIAIGMAMSLCPKILIADEPTTALDVSVQAQILLLMQQLQKETGTSLLFISHNLAVVSGIAHRVAVMYSGWIVEEALSEELFNNPLHPYTKALLDAVPLIQGPGKKLKGIPGQPPASGEIITGCKLHPRCSSAIKGICRTREPGYIEVSPGHRVRCFLYDREIVKDSENISVEIQNAHQ